MDLRKIRETVIVAISADDFLFEKLVLKGGNALDLIHHLGSRASVDIDFSMDGDFDALDAVQARLDRSLSNRFDALGFRIFDLKFGSRPTIARTNQAAMWGGYRASFKLISMDEYKRFNGDLESIRRNATVIGLHQERTFTIDISKFEYCAPKVLAEIDHYTIYVYTPAMIAAEKLRAICQQMPEYVHRRRSAGTARARDFYDVHAIVADGAVDLNTDQGHELIRHVFAAKEVPLSLLSNIGTQRAAHEHDWPAVLDSIPAAVKPRDFGYYFDFVTQYVERLEALWVE